MVRALVESRARGGFRGLFTRAHLALNCVQTLQSRSELSLAASPYTVGRVWNHAATPWLALWPPCRYKSAQQGDALRRLLGPTWSARVRDAWERVLLWGIFVAWGRKLNEAYW